MSKDRQQRREQQASVTSGQPARDVTQVGPAPTVSDEVHPCERPGCENLGHQSVKQGVWLCEVHRGISEPATRTPAEIIEHAERPGGSPPQDAEGGHFLRHSQFAGTPRRITLDVEVDGTEDMERLSQTILRQIHAMLLMQPSAPPKPPANIPKAVHHLRRAANALPGDALRAEIEDVLKALLATPFMTQYALGQPVQQPVLSVIAAALDLDVHAGAAAKDVRAAIEALS
jgi:hypothetical protein